MVKGHVFHYTVIESYVLEQIILEYLDIFDYETGNILTFLHLLIYKERVQIDEVAEQTGLNQKTVRKYMDEINDLFPKYVGERELEIKYERTRGFTVTAKNDILLEDFRIRYLLDTLEVKLSKALFAETLESPRAFAAQHFVSESLVRRKLNIFSKKIKKVNLGLRRVSLHLKGRESQIQYLYFLFLWSIYKGTHWPFTDISEGAVTQLQKEIYDFFGIKQSQAQQRMFIFQLAILQERKKANCLLSLELHWKEYFIDNLQFDQFWEFAQMDEAFSGLSSDDLKHIYLLVHLRFEAMFQQEPTDLFYYNQKRNTVIYQQSYRMKEIVESFFEEQRIVINDKGLSYLVALNYGRRLFPEFPSDPSEQMENARIFKKFPVLYQRLKECSLQILAEEGNHTSNQLDLLIQKLYTILTFQVFPTFMEKKTSVYLYTDCYYYKEEELMKKIVMNFQEEYCLEVRCGSLAPLTFADLVVSTVRVPEEFAGKYQKAILIGEIWNSDSHCRIEKELHNLQLIEKIE